MWIYQSNIQSSNTISTQNQRASSTRNETPARSPHLHNNDAHASSAMHFVCIFVHDTNDTFVFRTHQNPAEPSNQHRESGKKAGALWCGKSVGCEHKLTVRTHLHICTSLEQFYARMRTIAVIHPAASSTQTQTHRNAHNALIVIKTLVSRMAGLIPVSAFADKSTHSRKQLHTLEHI